MIDVKEGRRKWKWENKRVGKAKMKGRGTRRERSSETMGTEGKLSRTADPGGRGAR